MNPLEHSANVGEDVGEPTYLKYNALLKNGCSSCLKK